MTNQAIIRSCWGRAEPVSSYEVTELHHTPVIPLSHKKEVSTAVNNISNIVAVLQNTKKCQMFVKINPFHRSQEATVS